MEQKTERFTQLYALGMSKTLNGFAFNNVGIHIQTVNDLPDEEWTETLEQLKLSVNNLKQSISNITKSDREKLEDFIKSLGNVTGPELREKESQLILEGALHFIRMAREYIQESIDEQHGSKYTHN